MKISKLFHWLYAFLMFLPIVLFIPNAFYYGFNEHATAQEETIQEPVYYQSNEVTNTEDLITGNIYLFEGTNINFTNTLYIYVSEYVLTGNYTSTPGNPYLTVPYITCNANTINVRNTIDSVTTIYQYTNNAKFYFVYNGSATANITEFVNYVSYTDYELVKDYTDVTYSMSISNSMYQAWQSTWDLPLLQWTHNSFVAAPFTYITGLFGVPSDSSLNYIFAYFVSISICWLVFDLIMYVPNLAHRWLDKGALE